MSVTDTVSVKVPDPEPEFTDPEDTLALVVPLTELVMEYATVKEGIGPVNHFTRNPSFGYTGFKGLISSKVPPASNQSHRSAY